MPHATRGGGARNGSLPQRPAQVRTHRKEDPIPGRIPRQQASRCNRLLEGQRLPNPSPLRAPVVSQRALAHAPAAPMRQGGGAGRLSLSRQQLTQGTTVGWSARGRASGNTVQRMPPAQQRRCQPGEQGTAGGRQGCASNRPRAQRPCHSTRSNLIRAPQAICSACQKAAPQRSAAAADHKATDLPRWQCSSKARGAAGGPAGHPQSMHAGERCPARVAGGWVGG